MRRKRISDYDDDNIGTVFWFASRILKGGYEYLNTNFAQAAVQVSQTSDPVRLQLYDNLVKAYQIILDKKILPAENVEIVIKVPSNNKE